MRIYRKQNIIIKVKENRKEYHRQYYLLNKKEMRESQREWVKRNPHRHKIRYKNNIEFWRAYYRKYFKKKKKEDPQFRLNSGMARSIWFSLKGNKAGRKWETLVGYTLNELIIHLEFLFDENMSWSNYGSYWWIDHIKPKSLFNYDKPEDPEFKQCWALNNLQPLEAITNLRKGNKFDLMV